MFTLKIQKDSVINYMIPISPELISSVLGGMTGFLFKVYATKLQNEKDRFDRMLSAIKSGDESMDRAAQRDASPAGQALRRAIVFSILFSVVFAPFILALLGFPLITQIDIPPREHFMGLWTSSGKSVFYEFKGYLLMPELRQSLLFLMFYYFGQSTMKKS